VARHAPHLEVVRALRDQQVHQALALQLQRQRAVELERGREQHGRGHGLAQQLLHGGWVVLVLAQVEPRAAHAHGMAADGIPLENESADPVLAHDVSRTASSSAGH
jgi:hypothetical protein